MVKDDSMMARDKVTSNGSTGMAGAKVVKVKSQGISRVKLTGGTRKFEVNHALHVPNVSHSIVSFFIPCNSGHTVLFRVPIVISRWRIWSLVSASVPMVCMLSSLKRLTEIWLRPLQEK